jgi:hypothetical protein
MRGAQIKRDLEDRVAVQALTGLKSSGSWAPTWLAISQTMNQMTVMSGPGLRLRVSPRGTAVFADGLSTTSVWHRGALRDHQLEPPQVDSVLRRKPCLAREPVRCRTAQVGESHDPAGSFSLAALLASQESPGWHLGSCVG